jgi:hypothetical protein
VYRKLTTYSLVVLWLSAIGSIVFVLTIIGKDGGKFSFFSAKEDSSIYSFYDKKILSRNGKNIAQDEIGDEKKVVPQEAIKSSMLRQNVKLKTTVKLETTKPIIKYKPIVKAKSNDGFEIKEIPKN